MGFLGELVSRGRGPQVKPPPRTPSAISERIQTNLGIRHLESMPAQAARAFQLASDPKSQASDFIGVIESDEVLSARIIRIANSVYFFRGTPASDIERAVANIGLNELRCLLSASMLKSLLSSKHPSREQLWANSVATGICARMLAKHTKIDSGEAFLCGLLHDVGKLLFISHQARQYDRVLTLVSAGKTFLEAENEVFDVNHVEVGKWLAEEWNFSPSIVQAIAHHHDPLPREPQKEFTPAQLVSIADGISHAAGIGHPTSFRSFREAHKEMLPKYFRLVGLAAEAGRGLMENFTAQFDREYGLYQAEQR